MPVRPLLVLVIAVTLAACGTGRNLSGQEGQNPPATALVRCTACHGDPTNGNAAPPLSVHGATATTDVAVGAHQAHLQTGPLRQPVPCTECHVVPQNPSDPGHISGATATLAWGPLASGGGIAPAPAAGPAPAGAVTCSNYCHGPSPAAGGSNHAPVWNVVDGSQAACGTCHGIPPPPPHPPADTLSACSNCHPETVLPSGAIDVAGGKHIDGIVESPALTTGCTGCHGDPSRTPASIAPAPPRDTQGNTATTAPGVGAHQAHLAGGATRSALPCETCHVRPTDLSHVTGYVAFSWSALASTGGVTPSFDATALTCTNYCHGSSAMGGSIHAPSWTGGSSQAACGTCHGLPPPAPHPDEPSDPTTCANCHPGTVKADGTIDVGGGQHVDGVVEVVGGSCTACHGDPTRANAAIAHAPPRAINGATDPSDPGVGAHQAHLNPGALASALPCSECHVTPQSMAHASQAIELTFGPIAQAYGTTASFDTTALTCANFCHGNATWGGTSHAPVWNLGSSQAACGTCHAIPSAAGQHLLSQHSGIISSCATCHGAGYSTTGVNVPTHVDGTKTVVVGTAITSWTPSTATTPGTCTASCHSSPTEVRTW